MGAGRVSADGSITIFWGDAEYKFRYAIAQFRELQEKVNERRASIGAPLVGPMTLLNQIRAKDAWPDDMRDVLRIGLVGAGMSGADVHRKLVRYFDNRPPLESALAAHAVLLAGLLGDPSDKKADDVKKKTSQISPSISEPSSEQALQ